MVRVLLYLVFFCGSYIAVQGITTYYMDINCGTTLNMQNIYRLYSMRLKLTSSSSYDPDMNCMFTINTTSSEQLMFYFKSMDIEYSSSCRSDWLAIHDGGSVNSPLVPVSFLDPNQESKNDVSNGDTLNHAQPSTRARVLEHRVLDLLQLWCADVSGLSGKQCGYRAPSGNYHTSRNLLTLFFTSDTSYYSKGFDMIITRYHTGSCHGDEYSCDNDRCINDRLTCNGYNPCGDYSDCPLAAGIVAGIVIGSLCFVVLVVLAIICGRRRRRRYLQHKRVIVETSPTYGTPGVGYNQPVPQQYPPPSSAYPTGNQPPPPYPN